MRPYKQRVVRMVCRILSPVACQTSDSQAMGDTSRRRIARNKVGDSYTNQLRQGHAMQENNTYEYKCPSLEHANIISNALFLVLRDAFRYPGDVADFLLRDVSRLQHKTRRKHTCSRSLTQAYTTACVNCRVNASLEISISFW
jgi:hypothetical protein